MEGVCRVAKGPIISSLGYREKEIMEWRNI